MGAPSPIRSEEMRLSKGWHWDVSPALSGHEGPAVSTLPHADLGWTLGGRAARRHGYSHKQCLSLWGLRSLPATMLRACETHLLDQSLWSLKNPGYPGIYPSGWEKGLL